MSELNVFSYLGNDVRAIVIDDEPWWVASDVTAALGITNGRNATARLDEAGVRQMDIRSGGQMRAVTIIDEGNLYELVIRSDKPEARAFRTWITRVVLPEIRRTGSFSSSPSQAPAELTRMEILRMALDSETRALAAEATVTELTPRADAWDELAAAEGDYEVADAAKILARAGIETGRQRLFAQLEDMGWIYRGSLGKWTARQTAVDNGYLAEKPQSHHHPRTGALVLDPPQVRVTVRGLERLRVRLGSLEERPNLRAVSA